MEICSCRYNSAVLILGVFASIIAETASLLVFNEQIGTFILYNL